MCRSTNRSPLPVGWRVRRASNCRRCCAHELPAAGQKKRSPSRRVCSFASDDSDEVLRVVCRQAEGTSVQESSAPESSWGVLAASSRLTATAPSAVRSASALNSPLCAARRAP